MKTNRLTECPPLMPLWTRIEFLKQLVDDNSVDIKYWIEWHLKEAVSQEREACAQIAIGVADALKDKFNIVSARGIAFRIHKRDEKGLDV